MVAVQETAKGSGIFMAMLSIPDVKLSYYKEDKKIVIYKEDEHTQMTLWPDEQSFRDVMSFVRGLFNKQNNVCREIVEGIVSLMETAKDL